MAEHSDILLICASPRPQGTSAMLLRRIQSVAGGTFHQLPWRGSLDETVTAMRRASRIVISGPCWINSYPARLLELFETAAASGTFDGQGLYGIINGGMPYTHTHAHGLATLSLFARRCGLDYRGGFVLGGGAMLDGQPLERHLSRKHVVPAFAAFTEHIKLGQHSSDSLYEEAQRPPGRLLTRIFAMMLTTMAKRRIRKHGHDPEAPGYYFKQGLPNDE